MDLIEGMEEASQQMMNPITHLEQSRFLSSSLLSSKSCGLKRLKKKLFQLKSDKSNFSRNKNKVNYICPYCSYTCQDNSNFKRHVQVHTGEKPYHCPFCRYSTIHSSNLKTHIRNKHSNDLGNRPLSLKYCSSSTKGTSERPFCSVSQSILPPTL